jgi:hypothetical protein
MLDEHEHQHEIKTPVIIRNTETGDYTTCDAIWDTGATSSMIAENIAHTLRLKPVGHTVIAGVHGVTNANTYCVDVKFNIGATVKGIKVAEASNTGGFGLLVGMDIIGRGKMYLDGTSDVLSVTVEIPIED